MVQESKVKNVARNTLMGIFNNIILVFLQLISRKMFLNYIGIEFLSIGQVINNILGILAFSELGVANSVLYMLYKPIAENDKVKIAEIIGTYKKLNRIIGCVVFFMGILCVPFLPEFIHTSIDMGVVCLIFIMNLISSASTYFCSYRQVLLNADQKNYIVSKISLGINFFNILIQCTVIYMTHNYIIYLMSTIIVGLVQNIIIFYVAGKRYPFLIKYKKCRLEKEGARNLIENIKSMFSVKFCGIVINNTDNLLVSMINTLMVGYCANYTMISTRIKGIITIFHNSTMYSLGIASVEKDTEEKYELFKKIILINVFLGGITSMLFGTLSDDFIILWLGKKYLLPKMVMYSILLNYLWTVIIAPVWMFRDTNGLFKYVKKMLIINALLNIVLSVFLGKLMGISGVYFATIISDILTDFWYDVRLVYKKLFQRSDFWKYNLFIIINVTIILLSVVIINYLFLSYEVSIIRWFFKGIVTFMVGIVLYVLAYARTAPIKDIIVSVVVPHIGKRRM